MDNLTGIILAGGQSSRMGQDKGLTKLNGKPLIQYTIDTLKRIEIPIMIVANDSSYERFGQRVVKDCHVNKGPVGGIHSGLHNTGTEANIILGCDAPFIPSTLIQYLISYQSNSVTIVQLKDKLYPLIGYYNRSVLPYFENAIKHDQLKLTKLCSDLESTILDLSDHPEFNDPKFFENINTREELERYER